MTEALIALGSNVGDRSAHLNYAIQRLGAFGHVRAVSTFHETAPVGYANQGPFLNAALALETVLEPEALMAALLRIEAERGRERRILNGPRTLDLDLLLYGKRVVDATGLRVPHPRMHERAFVLAPLVEIAPGAVHPVLGCTVAELWAALQGADRG